LKLRRAARSIAPDRLLRHGEETQLSARAPIPVPFAAALIGDNCASNTTASAKRRLETGAIDGILAAGDRESAHWR